MSRNPFLIEGPALISFSGGRTSAYMLRRILDVGLQPDVHIVFANTGKERDETLDFVQECGERWGVPVRWVEWRPLPKGEEKRKRAQKAVELAIAGVPSAAVLLSTVTETEGGWVEVDHATASRHGEPFESIIRKKRFLPNPAMRYCTIELKIRTMKRFMVAQGYEHWTNIIGIRADEPRRVAKSKNPTRDRWENDLPLNTAGVTLDDVRVFWKAQPFDLRLQEWEGNCDLCFLKAQSKRQRIIQDGPKRAEWWQRMERETSQPFRAHGPNYSQLVHLALQPTLFDADGLEGEVLDDLGDCFCGD